MLRPPVPSSTSMPSFRIKQCMLARVAEDRLSKNGPVQFIHFRDDKLDRINAHVEGGAHHRFVCLFFPDGAADRT